MEPTIMIMIEPTWTNTGMEVVVIDQFMDIGFGDGHRGDGDGGGFGAVYQPGPQPDGCSPPS
jgi:hypothetical protein